MLQAALSDGLQAVEVGLLIMAAIVAPWVAVSAWIVRTLYQRTSDNNKQSGELRERVTAIETWRGEHDQRHDRLDGALTRIESGLTEGLGKLHEDVVVVQRQVAVLVDRAGRVE